MYNSMKTILVYDVTSTPEGVTMEEVMKSYNDEGILLFDGTKGRAPYTINVNQDTKLNLETNK